MGIKYRVYIIINGEKGILGTYETEQEATEVAEKFGHLGTNICKVYTKAKSV